MNRKELITQIRAKKTFLCVGLDTDFVKLPYHLQKHPDAVFEFNKAIIDATLDYCVSYKINTAFYESMGIRGWEIMEKTLQYIPKTHFTIADAKRADIGNTSSHYAKTFFEVFPFDAVTVAPYMGEDSIRPFLEYENKWTIVLGLTSNKGASDFQRLGIGNSQEPLYSQVIDSVSSWGTPDNLMFVVGATQSRDLSHIRAIIPDNFLLVPGIGAQGGCLDEVCKYGTNEDGGLLVNISRAILYAKSGDDFQSAAAEVAKKYSIEMASFI